MKHWYESLNLISSLIFPVAMILIIIFLSHFGWLLELFGYLIALIFAFIA